MPEDQIFSVKIPERPTGKAIACSFDSLKSQLVQAGVFNDPVTRLRIDTKEKLIIVGVEAKEEGDAS
jgi:hypothetical protein